MDYRFTYLLWTFLERSWAKITRGTTELLRLFICSKPHSNNWRGLGQTSWLWWGQEELVEPTVGPPCLWGEGWCLSRAAQMGHVGFREWDRLEGPTRKWEKPPGSSNPAFDPTPLYREEKTRFMGNTRRSHSKGKGGAEIPLQVCCFHQMVLFCLTLRDFPAQLPGPELPFPADHSPIF